MDELVECVNRLAGNRSAISKDDIVKALKPLLARTKPLVPFSSATFDQCERFDGLNLKTDYIATSVVTLHIPDDVVSREPSASLSEQLERIDAVWSLTNEKACRMVIDAILTEALFDSENEKLKGFCEVRNEWEGEGVRYTGAADYMLGTSKSQSLSNIDSFLLIVEAKKDWSDSAVPQVICEAGCLLRRRMDADKNTPVFAVLTNGLFFRFFAIDTNGEVYSSGAAPLYLSLGPGGGYSDSPSLREILRWFKWFLTAIKSISPRSTQTPLTAVEIKNSLSDLRKCFGVRRPNVCR